MYPRFSQVGDQAIRMTFAEELSEQINSEIRRAFHLLKNKDRFPYIKEMIPGYTTLTVCYNPISKFSFYEIASDLKAAVSSLGNNISVASRKIYLPVLYGGETGEDLRHVADYHQLTEQDIIERHTSSEYLVYMMGFSPGFPYLGGMDETIATPRLEVPRKLVESGSVGIAGAQTGVYSLPSPGGWQIIGRTPVSLFKVENETPSLLKSGDRIIFEPITKKDFDEIFHQDKKGIYKPRIEWKDDGGGEDGRDETWNNRFK